MDATFGVEEEFMLLDPATLRPAGSATLVMDAMAAHRPRLPATGEFFPSQVEHPSRVFANTEEARRDLDTFRAQLGHAAAGFGLLVGAVGCPFDVNPDASITDDLRYLEIATAYRAIVPDHQINGLHIHVGMPSRDAAIRAMNVLRPWLPALVALSANSPFWSGRDTGFDSWRAIHLRRWTTSGAPPHFENAADYDARVRALSGVGGTSDAGTLNWGVRPSARFPTVEIRVCDAQLNTRATVALAALVRGLVSSEPTIGGTVAPELLDASMWHAARDGLSGNLVDPRISSLRSADSVIEALLEEAAAGLEQHGDGAEVESAVREILSVGNGANRQRTAYRNGGLAGLASFVRHEASGDEAEHP